MNLNLFQLATMDKSVRIAIQKKPDGSFLLGISNGKEKPLVCQGSPEAISQEIEQKLEGYLSDVQKSEISAKLNEVSVDQHKPAAKPLAPLSLTAQPQEAAPQVEQDEFEFGF